MLNNIKTNQLLIDNGVWMPLLKSRFLIAVVVVFPIKDCSTDFSDRYHFNVNLIPKFKYTVNYICLVPPEDSSPLKKLFLILYSNEVLDDNECMIEIYGKRKLVAFSRLKSRLKEIFYQGVFIQNLNEENGEPKSSEINSTHKQTVIARILRENNANKLAIDLLEKSIIKTIKFHVTENVLSQARILSLYYSSVDYNKYKFANDLPRRRMKVTRVHWFCP